MQFPADVEIVDVTLRDGLQSLEKVYPTDASSPFSTGSWMPG